jgi:hypothetical protein
MTSAIRERAARERAASSEALAPFQQRLPPTRVAPQSTSPSPLSLPQRTAPPTPVGSLPQDQQPPSDSARLLEYGHEPGRAFIPISLHAPLLVLSMLAGWIGGPVFTYAVVFPRLGPFANGCVELPLLLGSAFGFALVPSTLAKRFLPARCPACGGRAFYRSLNPPRYRCRECARVHGM